MKAKVNDQFWFGHAYSNIEGFEYDLMSYYMIEAVLVKKSDEIPGI